MYSNNLVNFQESTTVLNACTKKSGNLLKAPRIYQSSSCTATYDPSRKLSKLEELDMRDTAWEVEMNS